MLLVFLILNFARAEEKIDYFRYEVKKKDTVSDLLYSLKMKPIYGPGNYLERTLVKNNLSESKAKNLEKGDILYIPISLPANDPAKGGNLAAFSPVTGESSSINATSIIHPKKKVFLERDKDEYDINVSLTYFNRSTRVSWQKETSNDSSVTFNESSNLATRLQINSRKVINASGLKIRPNYAFEYTQIKQSAEAIEGNLEYRPGFKADLALAIENYKSDMMINLAYQYEEMNTTDSFNDTVFVRRNYLNWAGLNLAINDNYFEKDFVHIFNVYASLKTRSTAEDFVLSSNIDKLIGGKLGYSLMTSIGGLNIAANYQLYLMTNDINNYNISSFGLSLGKWF